MRRKYVFVIWITLLVACQQPLPQPNFVIILVDDLGWNDVGYMGSTFYETPNIDALAGESFRFTQAYASGSVCSPSRAALLTGQHPVRLNITDWIPGQDPQDRILRGTRDRDELPLEAITIAEELKSDNYATMFAGKWHVGGEGFLPQDQGFDINRGGHHRGSPPGGYYTPYKNPVLVDGPEGEYLTDRLTTETMSFIDSIQGQPFLAFLSFYTVHTPIQPHLASVQSFEDKAKTLILPDTLFEVEGAGVTTIAQHRADYASMVYAMDQNVGRLIDHLKALGVYDHTTIIFTSDNGGLSTLEATRTAQGPTSVRPLRAGKGWLYEGGIRVPLLIKPAHWVGAGSTIDEPVTGHDLFPTIRSMAGATVHPLQPIDGVDLSPLMEGGSIQRESLWWHFPHYHGSAWTPGAAIREGDWKLIEFFETGSVELYNLRDDLSERQNLTHRYPDRVRAMQEELRRRQGELQAEFATRNDTSESRKL